MTRGERNHNPGNIRFNAEIRWQGQEEQDDGGFVVFDEDKNGIRAIGKVFLSYQKVHGLRTPEELIGRWAPPSENDTGAYVGDVCQRLGVLQTDPLNLSLQPTLEALVKATIIHENGACMYEDSLIGAACSSALGYVE